MNKKQLRKALRECASVFANVRTTSDDCVYMQVSKASVRLACAQDGIEYLAVKRDDGNLYID